MDRSLEYLKHHIKPNAHSCFVTGKVAPISPCRVDCSQPQREENTPSVVLCHGRLTFTNVQKCCVHVMAGGFSRFVVFFYLSQTHKFPPCCITHHDPSNPLKLHSCRIKSGTRRAIQDGSLAQSVSGSLPSLNDHPCKDHKGYKVRGGRGYAGWPLYLYPLGCTFFSSISSPGQLACLSI